MAQIIKFHTYKLKTIDDPVYISLRIGDKQIAATNFYLNSSIIKEKLEGSFSNIKVQDTDGTLSSKTLDISTTISEINPDENQIDYQYKVSGGATILNPPMTSVTATGEGIMHLMIKIIFV